MAKRDHRALSSRPSQGPRLVAQNITRLVIVHKTYGEFTRTFKLDDQGRLRVVVETPRGSAFKVRYDRATGVFAFQRSLHGLRYPHDWGFIPGTLAEDGDPLDALVVHEDATWPGILLLSEPVAVLKMRDKKAGAERELQNDRIIAVPSGSSRAVLSAEKRRELERFFQAAGEQIKQVRLLGWGDSDEARALIAHTRV